MALVKGSVVVLGVEEVTSLALKSHRFESGCGCARQSWAGGYVSWVTTCVYTHTYINNSIAGIRG